MASTYSTNLSLELPGTGDQSGTWGTTANRDMGTLLEQAVSGFVEQQFNTDADITLTLLSGADGGGNVTPGIIYGTSTPGTAASPVSARNMYINCTGTLTAARVLTVPTNRKLYYIYNNTTGGYALTVKTAAGTGISVPNGSKMLLVCDGTNIVESINYFSSLTFSSLTVTGNVTLSGGTANGVAYLNGSKIVTTGTGLTYDGTNLGVGTASPSSKLDVVGASTGTALELLRLSNTGTGASTQAKINFLSTSTSYATLSGGYGAFAPEMTFNLPSATPGNYIWQITSAEKMRLDASGNLGIGTTTPAVRLDVYKAAAQNNVAVRADSGQSAIFNAIGNGNSLGATSFDMLQDGSSIGYLFNRANAALVFGTNNTERMRLDSAGNLGLGVTPKAWGSGIKTLDIGTGTAVSNPGSEVTSWFAANAFYDTAWKYKNTNVANLYQMDGQHTWFNASSGTAGNPITFTQAMTLDAGGRLLVGRTSSAGSVYSLELDNGLSDNRIGMYAGAVLTGGLLCATNEMRMLGFGASTVLTFQTNSAERMRLDSSGYLGIGTVAPAQKLTVSGGFQITGTATLPAATSPGVFSLEAPVLRAYIGDGTGYSWAFSKRAASTTTDLMTITDTGNVGIGTTPSAWYSGSRALQIKSYSSLFESTVGITSLSFNAYEYAAGAYKYLQPEYASVYEQVSGNHIWKSATSGLAGGVVAFSERMRLDPSGNLLVGTTTNYGTLAVDTSKGATGVVFGDFTTFSNDVTLYLRSSGIAKFQNVSPGSFTWGNSGGTEYMRLNGSGNLGIGTASPSQPLTLGGSAAGILIAPATTTNSALTRFTNAGGNAYVGLDSSAAGLGAAYGLHLYHAGAYPIVFSTNNTERMRIDSSGNVWVGGIAPGGKFGVYTTASSPNIYLHGHTTSQIVADLYITRTGASEDPNVGRGSAIQLYNETNITGVVLQNYANALQFFNGGSSWTERMRLDASGSLLVNSTASSFAEKFSVLGTGATTPPTNLSSLAGSLILVKSSQALTAYGGVGYNDSGGGGAAVVFGRGSSYDTNIGFYTNPSSTTTPGAMTERMRIDSSGNVGINAAPTSSYKLLVSTGAQNCAAFQSNSGQPQITVSDGNVQVYVGYTGGSGASGLSYYGTSTNHDQLFITNNSERARINSGGQFLVGASAAAGFEVFCASNIASNTPPISSWNRATTGDNYFLGFWTETTATIRGSVTYNRAGGLTAYNTTSDYRAKDIFGPVQDSGVTIDALAVYNGKMKGATIERPMMVAHEAQAVAPYAVSGEKDAVDKDGKPVYQQIDYSTLVPLLIAEIQSLRTRVAQLEGR